MPNDQFGRHVSVGDTVTLVGEVTKILEDPNFVNCTVKLQKTMPPSGTEVNLQLNTAQLELKSSSGGGSSKSGGGDHAQQAQPQHGAAATKK